MPGGGSLDQAKRRSVTGNRNDATAVAAIAMGIKSKLSLPLPMMMQEPPFVS